MPTKSARKAGGGFDGIARRDSDRLAYQIKQQRRRDLRDSRAGKRGFGNHFDPTSITGPQED